MRTRMPWMRTNQEIILAILCILRTYLMDVFIIELGNAEMIESNSDWFVEFETLTTERANTNGVSG